MLRCKPRDPKLRCHLLGILHHRQAPGKKTKSVVEEQAHKSQVEQLHKLPR